MYSALHFCGCLKLNCYFKMYIFSSLAWSWFWGKFRSFTYHFLVYLWRMSGLCYGPLVNGQGLLSKSKILHVV